MVEIVFCYIQELFEIYVLNRFINIFFCERVKNKKVYFYLLIVYWIINGTLNIVEGKPWINLLTSIGFLLLIAIVNYEGIFWKKLLVVFSIVSVAMVCEDLIWIVLNHYFLKINNNFLGSILAIFLLLIFEVMLQKCLRMRDETPMMTIHYLFMVMIPICSIIITYIIVDGSFKVRYALLIGISMIMFINIFSFYLNDVITNVYEEKWKNDILEKQLSMYENQFEIIKESQEKLRSFRHDIKHHFMMISEYAKRGETKNLFEYIDQGIKNIEVEKEYVKSGNEEIDCILNYMIDKAKKIGTEIDVKIKVPEETFMSRLDLNIFLSNLLENAIEALKQAESKELSVCINMEKEILYISIYNTYDTIMVKCGEFMSQKRNYIEKGIGLENVNKIVNKYSGKINMNCEEGVFKVDAILFLKDE